MGLIPFGEATRRLRVMARSDLGIREIPVGRIIGSVDRSADFDREFWCQTVYLPGVDAARRASLPELYASWHSTDGDLFLWLYQLRRDLRGFDRTIDFDDAARHAQQLHLGRRRKREHLRNGRRPLPRVQPDPA
jgi:hypothetical protein